MDAWQKNYLKLKASLNKRKDKLLEIDFKQLDGLINTHQEMVRKYKPAVEVRGLVVGQIIIIEALKKIMMRLG